jgi:RNA polymerase sigma factor (sigma-70 family)
LITSFNWQGTLKEAMQCNSELDENVRRAGEIFDEYGNAIQAFVRFHVGDDAQVDDIFQSLFLSLVRNPVPPAVENMKSYLYRAVCNDVRDAARRRKSYQARILRYSQYLNSRIVLEETPEDAAIMAEDREQMFEMIERQLPAREAQAVILRYRYGHSIAESAERMRIRKKSLSRYLCMGLKKIRQLFGEREMSSLHIKGEVIDDAF